MLCRRTEHDFCFNASPLNLQIPIATLLPRTGHIFRGRHIGTGDLGQTLHKSGPFATRTDIAAIKKQITVCGQGISPPKQILCIVGKCVVGEGCRTQGNLAIIPVRDDMDGVHGRMLGQNPGNLTHAILRGIQPYDGLFWIKPLAQCFYIFHLGIDKDNFPAFFCWPKWPGRFS